MNRAYTGSFLDISAITLKPMRGLAFFLMGASICVFINISSIQEQSYNQGDFHLQQKVAHNEHTHALVKTLGQQLDTRNMTIWDANPR